jgi:hypothetical protein
MKGGPRHRADDRRLVTGSDVPPTRSLKILAKAPEAAIAAMARANAANLLPHHRRKSLTFIGKCVISATAVHILHARDMQIDRQCEKFMGGPTVPYTERIHVTISPKGSIFLNQKAHKMMGRPLAVYLYFNRPKDMIILEPTDALTSNAAFLLRDNNRGSGRHIYANPFCKHFGIRLRTTERFIEPAVDAVGRMYLKLSETVNVSAGPRKRKARTG